MPHETLDVISYASIGESPFGSIPLDDLLFDTCIKRISYLLPIHILSLPSSILRLPSDVIVPNLPSFLGLFSVSSCAEMMCNYILEHLGASPSECDEILRSVCDAGAISVICRTMVSAAGENCTISLAILLAQIVLAFDEPKQSLSDNCSEMLSTVFSIDSIFEFALIIAAHLARLSSEYVNELMRNNIFSSAVGAINSKNRNLRLRATSVIANITKHVQSNLFVAKQDVKG